MKKLLTILLLSLTTLTAFSIAGCADKTIKQQLAHPELQGKKGIEIVSIDAQYQGAVLKVRAEIANNNKKNARVFYRFRWLDGQNNVVEASDQWKPILIYGKRSAFITDAAPHADVVDYRLEFNVEPNLN